MNAQFATILIKRLPFLVLAAAFVVLGLRGARTMAQSTTELRQAPSFSLQDSSGKIIALNQYAGKVVLLDFWATWCHGCKEEIPWFAAFHRKYSAKGLNVIGVSMDDDGWKSVKPFLARTDVPYTIVISDNDMAKMYRIETMPDTFLIDRHGQIAAAYVGMVNKDEVEKKIQALLDQK